MINRTRAACALALLATVAALSAALFAGTAEAALKHLDGTVTGKDAAAGTFRIGTQGGRSVSFKVNRRTVFERIGGGLSGLRKGMAIEVDYVKAASGNLARQIEPQGGHGGGHGGGDDSGGDHGHHGGGHDDGPGHT